MVIAAARGIARLQRASGAMKIRRSPSRPWWCARSGRAPMPIQTAKQVTDRLEKPLESLRIPRLRDQLHQARRSHDHGQPAATARRRTRCRTSGTRCARSSATSAAQLPQGAIGPFFNDDFGDVYGVIYALTSDGFTLSRAARPGRIHPRRAAARAATWARWTSSACRTRSSTSTSRMRQMAGLGISAGTAWPRRSRSQNAVIASGTIETPGERIAVRVSGALDSVSGARERRDSRSATGRCGLQDFAARERAATKDPPVAAVPLQRPAGDRHRRVDGEGRQRARPRRGARKRASTRIESDLPVGIDVHRVADQPEVVEESVGAVHARHCSRPSASC